jgi:hypothetical protein
VGPRKAPISSGDACTAAVNDASMMNSAPA